MANSTTIAAPISWIPSSYWDGNDGLWNTFLVKVGTPPQEFRTLPSTAGQETWLPNPEGCTTADPSDPGYCGYLRGTLPFNGVNSSGFENNQSSTWDLIGLYTLDAQELELGYSGNGLYGFDTVSLIDGNTSDALFNQTMQVVASVPDLDFWLGVFGLGPKSINFTTFNDPIQNFMSDLLNSSQIPSLSWGYTAGAYYRNKTPASLTLGGYDDYRVGATNLNFSMNVDNSRPLQVGVQKILAENTLGGSGVNLLPTAVYHFIDSTLPHIWLPDDAIQAFVDNFGLTYDNNTDLYLINDTMRNQWLQNRPTVTFQLGTSDVAGSGGETVNIELPYAAFDMQASYPYYENATNYFPIRKAVNDTQYTLGRTFLQEAYLTADFERSSFTVAQTSFDNLDLQHLVAIESPAQANSSSSSPASTSSTSSSLSGGTIAGIVIGAVAGITLVTLAVWYFLRRNKRKHQPLPTSDPVDGSETVFATDKKDTPYSDHRGSELPSENALHEAPGLGSYKQDPSELPGGRANEVGVEMEGDMGRFRARPGMAEMPSPGLGHGYGGFAAEAPGSEGQRYELMGSEPVQDAQRTL
ncbi:hypothetical protein LTR85_003592 [Meristemomyces frigidus]|nr:hypothetical protein LTR85_003592 [Meristemomyces frigidus]